MVSLTPDNMDLLKSASTLRIDLEFLIYTIETHRSLTGNRFVKARIRFADGLTKFLKDATVPPQHTLDSTITHPEPASRILPFENPETTLTTNALSGVDQAGFRPVIRVLTSETTDTDKIKALKPGIKSQKIIPSGNLPTNKHTATTKGVQPQPIPAYIKNSPKQPILPIEKDRTISIKDIPSGVSRAGVLAQICGGAVERIDLFPHQDKSHCDASITFVLPSSAKAYMRYVHTPRGRLVFPGSPAHLESTINWNPHPPKRNYIVSLMAQDPNIRARRCLIIRNFPTEVIDSDTLHQKLSKLEGKFARIIEIQKISIDEGRREAMIVMDKISCALQVMQSKALGKLGKEFDGCSFEYDKDHCERPIPGFVENIPSTTSIGTKEIVAPAIHSNYRPDERYSHTLNDTLNTQEPRTQRTLYIPELPINTTTSDLVPQLRGGALERIVLIKHKQDEGLAGCITFVHQSSAKTCYEYLNSPEGRLKFSGVVWDWPVSWERNPQNPIREDLLEKIMDPTVNARRGFVIKNFPSQEVFVETLKADVLSQSLHILPFEKFEVNMTKQEGRVIMSTIGAAVGAIKSIKRLQRYRGCIFEYLRDECEDSIPMAKGAAKEPKDTTPKHPEDSSDVVDAITQSNNSPTTLIINYLPVSITLSELSARIRGGALDSLEINTFDGQRKATASVTFLDNSAAQSYLDYMKAFPNSVKRISWKPRDITNVTNYSNKGIRRVLIVKGFPSVFTKERIINEIEKFVKKTIRELKMHQKGTVESIHVRGDEKKEARVVMASIKLAVLIKAGLPKSWKVDFGRDICEGDLTQLIPA